MTVIKNLTNGAIDLPGGRILPAYGETEATDISGEYLAILQASAAVSITASTDDTDCAEAELETWRSLYESEKGEAPDGRWGIARIQQELDL